MSAALLTVLAALLAATSPLGDDVVPTPIGAGAAYHPAAWGTAVAQRRSVAGLRCRATGGPRYGIHLELFARRRVVIVPAGIGVAPPWTRDGVYVERGDCSYAARTRKPTGVIETVAGTTISLGDFFDLWGQPLGRTRLAGFRTNAASPVRAYVDGRRWRRDLRAVPLRRHAEIVLELGAFVPPHPSYRFERGL